MCYQDKLKRVDFSIGFNDGGDSWVSISAHCYKTFSAWEKRNDDVVFSYS